MARLLSHKAWRLLVALVLPLLVVEGGQAQTQPPPPPPIPREAPDKAPPPALRELSAQEIDGILAKVFGRDGPELRRPIRIGIQSLSLVIAAEEVRVARDGRSLLLQMVSVVLGDPQEAQPRVLRGERLELTVDRSIGQPADLKTCAVTRAVVHEKTWTITLSPAGMKEAAPPESAPQAAVPSPAVPTPVVVGSPPQAAKLEVVQKEPPVDLRFKFQIDPKASLSELLPAAPSTTPARAGWANEDLAKVPEVTLGEPLSRDLGKVEAMTRIAHALAKVNHLNQKKTDGFMLALLSQRADLRGLSVLMGEECRTREAQARAFAQVADGINQALKKLRANGGDAAQSWEEIISSMRLINTVGSKEEKAVLGFGCSLEQVNRAVVAAAMQILMPESEPVRLQLARFLALIPHADATKALARLAIFSPEESVRAAALEGLKLRRERDYTDLLLQGLQYPLPAVARRSAEALVKLERKDLLDRLVDVLEQPDPRLPASRKVEGKDVLTVREVVRVNHNRNCMLCHAPGNTSNMPEGVLTAAVPLPSEPLPKPSDGGYQSVPPPTPDIVVRIDMTYLRQDFSMMMPVADAHPWPDLQRFDFLVRARVLTPDQAKAYPAEREAAPGVLSPYHRAALYALRELTGRDAAPTAQAWRKLLKLPG
jgi:hypothetical protein